jgi:putative component of toxin-antitoxin plasmid stabilization module
VYVIKTLPEFDAWLKGLTDETAQRQLVVMLGGGAKSSQRTDIAVAQRRAGMIEED